MSLEVKDYQKYSPQFWMIHIPYQKQNVVWENLLFLSNHWTSRA